MKPLAAALIAAFACPASVGATPPGPDTLIPDVEKFAAAPPTADEVFLQIAAPLDEARRYCIDVPGFGTPAQGLSAWQADWPLDAHTCKTGALRAHYFFVDQLISLEALAGPSKEIRFTRLPLCVESQNVGGRAGAPLIRRDALVLTKACADNRWQRFTIDAQGQVRPTIDETKCLTLGAETFESGNQTPTIAWHRRDLSFSACAPEKSDRQTWRLQKPPPDPS